MDNYLKILEESLRKKLQVLEQIQIYNEKQREAFENNQAQLEEFDAAIEEKGKLIEQINKLDEGFEALYANVAQELQGNKEKYAAQIKILQQLVKEVTAQSMAVQTQEARNKALVEAYFAKGREEIRQGRKSSKAVFDYYRNLNKPAYMEPQFMDSKK